MISPAALSGLPFPWLLLDHNKGLLASRDGALFPSPPYSVDSILDAASGLAEGGWTVCPNGYALFKFSSAVISPASIVLHGLKVHGLSTAKGRLSALSINLSMDQ